MHSKTGGCSSKIEGRQDELETYHPRNRLNLSAEFITNQHYLPVNLASNVDFITLTIHLDFIEINFIINQSRIFFSVFDVC